MLPSPATSSMLDRWEIYVDRAYEAQGDVHRSAPVPHENIDTGRGVERVATLHTTDLSQPLGVSGAAMAAGPLAFPSWRCRPPRAGRRFTIAVMFNYSKRRVVRKEQGVDAFRQSVGHRCVIDALLLVRVVLNRNGAGLACGKC